MNGGKGVGMAGGPGDIRENETAPFREDIDRKPANAVRVLLEGGADPNRPTSGESTLLHDAARARNLEIIRALAEHGAKLDALNGSGLTALDVAEGRRGEGGGGYRHSDTVLVRGDGCERLTRVDDDLDALLIAGWKPRARLRGAMIRRAMGMGRKAAPADVPAPPRPAGADAVAGCRTA